MHEAYRGYHSGLPERRASRERRFGGRGPKGYRRSDDRIRDDICDELMRSEDVDATDITVAVRDGEVTLDGTVHDRGMKCDAESCADAVLGVRDVHNRLQLRPPADETRAQ